MKQNAYLLGALLAISASCSKGDECQQFADKSGPIMAEMAKASGKPMPPEIAAMMLAECRKPDSKMKTDPVFKCVLGASGTDAVKACYGDAMSSFGQKSKRTEAELNLNRIGKNLKVQYVTNSIFPVGKAAKLPATNCCDSPDRKCAVTADWAKDAIWSELDFQMDDPGFFQYSYESDGKTATATAVGDLDCDGTFVTYKMTLTSEGGNPQMTLTKPENAD
jgi:hypothetical protein